MNINTSILIDTHMDTLNHQVKALMGTLRGGGGGEAIRWSHVLGAQMTFIPGFGVSNFHIC